ncbi:MAG TPA: response regulator transcription factor [Xanthobacteraceae bacterium]|nr:response regulator transcription factor [Xanthobacteraceae bacterium]
MFNLIRVAVIDDHPLFLEGLVGMLAHTEDVEVVGQGATASDALKIAQDLHPDVILLDVVLPGGGVEAAAAIARTCPKVCIVMLTASEEEHHVSLTLQAGARGYILKGSSSQEIIDAVRAVASGDSYVPPTLAARLLIKRGEQTEAAVIRQSDLTSREETIFSLVGRGMSNKEIARGLNCTERTVKHHMTNIMKKLGVRNRVQAALKLQTGRN